MRFTSTSGPSMNGRTNRGTARQRRSAARRFVALFLTLRGRLILLVCFATVPAILFIFFAAVNERESALERMETEARHLGNLAAREHAHQLNGAASLLRRLGGLLACEGETTVPPCPAYLPALLSGFPQFANIGVADVRGEVVCSAAKIQHSSLKTNIAFERALGSDEVESGTYVVGFIGRPVLHLGHALLGPNRAPCAVAFVAVELGWLDQLAKQANLPTDYSLLIVDRTGRVLAGSGAAAADVVAEHGAPNPTLAQMLDRPRGAIVEIGSPARSRYFVATPMDGVPGVFAVAGLPHGRMQEQANRAFYRTLVGLILVTLFAIASAIMAAELSVLRALRALTHAVRRFGAGDLSARAPLPGSHGELRELAVSFSSMADALAIRQREASEAQGRLRALSQRLQLARDEEAGRIARELHDELGQMLTGLKLELSRVRRLCSGNAAGEDAMRQMSEQISSAIDSVRRISSELRPPVLDRLGLAAAIDWLVRDCEAKANLAIVLNVSSVLKVPDDLVSTTVFRIVQEALTNVVRHAGATEISIDLVGDEDALTLTIHDNGRGIDPAATVGPQALGILGMRERIHLVGGSFRIEGSPGEGTTIVVKVPQESPNTSHPVAGQEQGT